MRSCKRRKGIIPMASKKSKNKDKSIKKAKPMQQERSFCSVLYMLPDKVTVKQMAEALDFLPKEAVEIWTEVNLLEITLDNGTLTFEDMMEQIESKEDVQTLAKLQVSQVYACDYEASDKAAVRKVMETLIEKFGGFLASDTEDFAPFIKPEEL